MMKTETNHRLDGWNVRNVEARSTMMLETAIYLRVTRTSICIVFVIWDAHFLSFYKLHFCPQSKLLSPLAFTAHFLYNL